MHTALSMIHVCGAIVGLLPHVLLIGAMFFRLYRVRFSKRSTQDNVIAARPVGRIASAPLGATGAL